MRRSPRWAGRRRRSSMPRCWSRRWWGWAISTRAGSGARSTTRGCRSSLSARASCRWATLGWERAAGVVWAVVVLAYIYAGGLRGAIYNEVLQFFLICAGFLPLVYLGLEAAGGWAGVKAALDASYVHAWQGLDDPHSNRLGVEWFG